MAKNLLFSFDDMKGSDKPAKELTRWFKRAGQQVVSVDVKPSVQRAAGISFREMLLSFADSQTITLRIKQTGDIYQVMLNGRAVPLRNPDNHSDAVSELVKLMDKGRAIFQKKLAAVKVALPATIRTAAPKIQEVLTQKRDALKVAIAAVDEEIAKAKGQAI